MKKTNIILFMLLIFSSIIVTSSGLEGWNPLGNNIFMDNLQNSVVTADWSNATDTVITSNSGLQQSPNSPSNQILTSEVFNKEGKFAVIRDSNGIKIIEQENMLLYHFEPNSNTVTGEFYLGDMDEDGITEMVYLNNISGTNYLVEVEMNHPYMETNLTILPSEWNIGYTTPSCFKKTGESPACYFRTPYNRYVKVSMNNKSISQYNDSTHTLPIETYGIYNSFTPIIADIDQDIFNTLEGLWIKKITGNANLFGGYETFMLDLETMTPDTYYSTDGYLNVSTPIGQSATNFKSFQPILYQADDSYSGSSPYEILFNINYLVSGRGVWATYIESINADGTTIGYEEFLDTTNTYSYYGSNSILTYDYTGLSPHVAVCNIIQKSNLTDSGAFLNCYDGDFSASTETSITGNDFEVGIIGSSGDEVGTTIYSADVNNDGINEIIASFGIINIGTGETFLNFKNRYSLPRTNRTPIPVPDNLDKLAFLWIDTNQSKLFESITAESVTNQIPTITDYFTTSYANPVCTGTSLLIIAEEYNETEGQGINQNYYNDNPGDEERLRTDCAGETGLRFSEWSSNNPYVECDFNSPGTFYVEIFLQDNYNPSDLSVSLIQEIRVIDFTEDGELCNDELGYIIDGATSPLNTTGTPCDENKQCLTGLCEYGYCALKEGGIECSSGSQCISGQCKNNKCTKPSLNQRLDNQKNVAVGDDSDTNNLVSLFFMYIWIVPLSAFGIGGVLAGLILAIPIGIFFAIKGWLSGFILFGIIMVKLIIMVVGVLIFKES